MENAKEKYISPSIKSYTISGERELLVGSIHTQEPDIPDDKPDQPKDPWWNPDDRHPGDHHHEGIWDDKW